MKYLLIFTLLLILQKDSKHDYALLIGSWEQKMYKGTPDTGIFTFHTDNTVTLEMKKGGTGEMLASADCPYSIDKKTDMLTIRMFGQDKKMAVLKLEPQMLQLHLQEEGKEPQTFRRIGAK